MIIEKINEKSKVFSTAYVVEPTHDFSQLTESCSQIKYITSGYENFERIVVPISEMIDDFVPGTDVLILSGKNFANLILGLFLQMNVGMFYVGLYSKQDGYKFYQIILD